MRARLVPTLLLALLALAAACAQTHAKDVYGNNTAWTNSDTTIYNIQREHRAQEAESQW